MRYTKHMRFQGGFTVVEVMIFLTISMIVFLSAQSLLQGQGGRTAFEQGIKNLASQLQSHVDEVGNSVIPGAGQYACTVPGSVGRPVLSTGGQQGSNQGCIFLGSAFQVVPGQSKMYVYGVLGTQFDSNGGVVTSFSQANPTPAIDSSADLTQEIETTWGKLTSSKVTLVDGTTQDSDLIGFYNSLQDGYLGSQTGGAQSIFAKGYSFISNDPATARSSAISSCIEEQNANGYNCQNTPTITLWRACYASTGSNQTALLDLYSTPAGATSNVTFTSCQ